MGEKAAGGKLRDIKETASDAVEIVRELGTPGVQETFSKIRELSITAKEIMETMKTPEWQRNIDNFRQISDNFNQASERLDRMITEIKKTGVIDEAKDLMNTAKNKVNSFGSTGEGEGINTADLKEVVGSVKEMIISIRSLVDELRLIASESRRTGTLRTVEETIGSAREAANALRDTQKRSQ